ncbi:MAG: hypothetical protein H8D34_29835 [Chloroflexi bacterium]|nr:hypothetical protein [Chloroflexota bacterium]
MAIDEAMLGMESHSLKAFKPFPTLIGVSASVFLSGAIIAGIAPMRFRRATLSGAVSICIFWVILGVIWVIQTLVVS